MASLPPPAYFSAVLQEKGILAFTTVFIQAIKGDESVANGTGFIFRTREGATFLITCRHLLEEAQRQDCNELFARFHLQDTKTTRVYLDGREKGYGLTFAIENAIGPGREFDVVAFPFDPPVGEGNVQLYFVPILSEWIPSNEIIEQLCDWEEEVVMYGYPATLLERRMQLPLAISSRTSIHPALCAHETDVRRDKLLEHTGEVGLLSTAAPQGASGAPVFSRKRNGTYPLWLGMYYSMSAETQSTKQNHMEYHIAIVRVGFYVKSSFLNLYPLATWKTWKTGK